MNLAVQKALGGLLFALILVVGLNLGVGALFGGGEPAPADTGQATANASSGTPSSGTPSTAETGGAAEKPLPQRLAAADPKKGQAIARKCQSCHSLEQGGGTKVGPNLYGVAGRPKGSVPGFAYSDALKKLGGAWSDEDLDHFLTKPSAFAKGTKMTFAGLPDPQERADVIAYLHSLGSPPTPR